MWDSKRKHLYSTSLDQLSQSLPNVLTICASLEPAPDFIASRTAHGWDRFVEGTSPVLILNAKILTGARNGTEIVFGDVLLDKGVILGVGYIPRALSPRPHWPSPVESRQILPGSANNIGGQAFLIKLRPTVERSASAMLLEPPLTLGLNGSEGRPKWRHMKHACGENPSDTYSQTRINSAWAFRTAYDEARKIRDAQDAFCVRAEAGLWDGRAAFPEILQWESLSGHKLSYRSIAVDLDQLVRLSNEFKIPIASIHHAGETDLVPDLLKKAWGNIPHRSEAATCVREALRHLNVVPGLTTSTCGSWAGCSRMCWL
ncbi:hypothetical protein B0H13DRAFT_2561581 [Mycena leptocephala]|nr:hypothetical protein B0H13DRAFT_2561581 [Mycena leptocephala]